MFVSNLIEKISTKLVLIKFILKKNYLVKNSNI